MAGRPKMTDEEKELRRIQREQEGEELAGQVEEMASLMTSRDDIADMLYMSVAELDKKLRLYAKISLDQLMRKAEAARKMSLKYDMFALAKKNGTVATYLGKLYIESQEEEDVAKPMEIRILDGSKDDD